METPGPDGYGLGVSIRQTAEGLVYGHSGWFPGYRTEVAYFPDLCLAVAFQTNTDRADGGAAVQALVRAAVGAAGSAPPIDDAPVGRCRSQGLSTVR
ncbi:MAG: hypothetical protein ACRDHY_02440 [Anaerolineales bacterium]